MVIGVVVLAAAAWMWHHHAAGSSGAPTGHLSVSWRGLRRGEMTLPAELHWCPVTRIGVIDAVSGDSGVAIVLFEQNAITNGVHPIRAPQLAGTSPRPGAAAALRWMRFQQDSSLEQFRATDGTVRVRLSQGTASGEMTARMHSASLLGVGDTILVQGVFRDVPMVTTAAGCT